MTSRFRPMGCIGEEIDCSRQTWMGLPCPINSVFGALFHQTLALHITATLAILFTHRLKTFPSCPIYYPDAYSPILTLFDTRAQASLNVRGRDLNC